MSGEWLLILLGLLTLGLFVLLVLHRLGVACIFCKYLLELRWFYYVERPIHEGREITDPGEQFRLGVGYTKKMSLQYRIFRGNWNTVPIEISPEFGNAEQRKIMTTMLNSGSPNGCRSCGH